MLGILAGTLPAQGPGVRITLNDPDGKMTSSNLLDAIEELRDAGAEAIQINGSVRVVASTDLSTMRPGSGSTARRSDSPYVIEAIGESHNLSEAANFPGGLVSEVTGPQIGGTAEVTELPTVQITALHAPGRASLRSPGTQPDQVEPSSSAPERKRTEVYPEDLKYTAEHEWVKARRGPGAGRHHRLRAGRAR